MKKDVHIFISSCLTCQQTKNDHQKRAGLLCPLPIPASPWEDLSLDFIVGLPPSQGHSTVLVIVDRFSKGVHLGSLPAQHTAFAVAQLFMEICGKLHGQPRSLVSDRDPLFLSRFWRELFKLSGTTLKMSTAYHPQTDGQTEVMNRVIEQYLRAFVHRKPTTWRRFLVWAEWSYNTSTHSATGMSPYEITFGKKPPHFPRYLAGISKVEAVDTWISNRDTMIKFLTKKLAKAQLRMKEVADKRRRDVHFNEGDLALVRLRPRRQSTVSGVQYSKLAKKFYGPFRVLQRIGPVAYKLDLPPDSRIHPVFHCSLLRPYHPSQDTQTRPNPLPKDAEDHQPLISPLVILDTKWQGSGDDKQLLVLVQWAGLLPEDTTWEPWTQLQAAYNLEDKVVFHEQGNDIAETRIKKQIAELAETEPKKAESPDEGAKTEESRPKRTLTNPSYLRDFVG